MKKKYYLSMILLCLALIASMYYVFFRENEIEDGLNKSKIFVNQTLRNIDLDRFPLRLQLEFDRLLKDFKNIQLSKVWTTEIDFDLTHPPFFDLRNLYLISFDKIAVYDKNSMQNIWRKQFDHDIKSFSLINGNNIFITDIAGHVYLLNRNSGEISWYHHYNVEYIDEYDFSTKPFQITNNEDKRLLTGIIILPISKELIILDINTGQNLFTLPFDDYIYHISEYDQIENSMYVSYGNKIAKIYLEKR